MYVRNVAKNYTRVIARKVAWKSCRKSCTDLGKFKCNKSS